MAFTPLDEGLLTSTLLKEGPDVVAIWALVMADSAKDRYGRTKMTPIAAASLLRISDERARAAFAVLSAPDPDSRNKEHEGRRLVPDEDGFWLVVSHARYRELASKASANERQRQYMERKKQKRKPSKVKKTSEDVARLRGSLSWSDAAGRLLAAAEQVSAELGVTPNVVLALASWSEADRTSFERVEKGEVSWSRLQEVLEALKSRTTMPAAGPLVMNGLRVVDEPLPPGVDPEPAEWEKE